MAPRLLPLVSVLLAAAIASAEAPPLPGPAPRPLAAHEDAARRAQKNASCVACHEDIGREWASSLHRQAWRDPVFQKAYLVEPVAFCRGCHAPESDPASAPTARAMDVGVGCVTCHVENGGVHGVHASPEALHPVFADARLATPAACASCHQFDFPKESHQLLPQAMQDTLGEHARSRHAAAPCQSCHMPLVDGPSGRHKSHAFSVVSSPEMIRKAARVTAERLDARTARVEIVADRVGHAFPTGDMFRRLEVRLEALDARGRLLAAAPPVVLARSFEDVPRDPGGRDLTFQRVEAADTRVAPDGTPSRVVLALPHAVAGARLRWRVVYQRMSTPMAEAFGVSQVLDEILVAEGELPAPVLSASLARKGAPR
jgi:hypothetical protein